MLRFIKIHWFGLSVSIVFGIYFCILFLVFISPQEDSRNRGFIPCTREMSQEIFSCSANRSACLIKAVLKNSACDTKVVWQGLKSWFFGNQKTPWENYLFTPKKDNISEEIPEELKMFYEQNPDLEKEMQQLEQQSKLLEENLENTEDETPRSPEQEI